MERRRLKVARLPENWRDYDFRYRPRTACVVRYGGFGDMIMASVLFPVLKREGYTVVVNASAHGSNVLFRDPNIDEMLIQERNQVPQSDLLEYWERLENSFERFINLSGSIETNLLPAGPRWEKIGNEEVFVAGDEKYHWPDERRRSELNRNYIEETFAAADIPFDRKSPPTFYPSKKEAARAEKEVSGKIAIVWALSGSSVHKTYPWLDSVIAAILTKSRKVHFYLVGDAMCKILEQGWEKEPRVHCLSGEMSIRDTLALAQRARIVIGPETGVLNAVSALPCRKIVFLSHSSVENLTKHWRNTLSLTSDVECYPCHRLHHGFKDCPRDDFTRVAKCAATIEPKLVVNDIMRELYGDERIVA